MCVKEQRFNGVVADEVVDVAVGIGSVASWVWLGDDASSDGGDPACLLEYVWWYLPVASDDEWASWVLLKYALYFSEDVCALVVWLSSSDEVDADGSVVSD